MANALLKRRVACLLLLPIVLHWLNGCGGSAPRTPPLFGAPADTSTTLARVAFVLDRGDGLREPLDLEVDTSGRLLVLDGAGPDVLAFDADGRFIAIWPVSGATDERFFRPTRIAISGLQILLMDPDERVVHRHDMRGQYQGVALDLDSPLGLEGEAEFVEPVDIAADNAGRIYVTDRDGHRVLAFDQRARFQFAIGGFGSSEGQLRTPGALTADRTGALIIADRGNHRVQVIDPFGTPLTLLALPPSPGGRAVTPLAVAENRGRTTFVADDAGRLLAFSPSGRARLAHRLGGISALAVHPNGRVFCLSASGARVDAIDLGGR